MTRNFDAKLKTLSWTQHEITHGKMSRREFVQFAVAIGMSAAAADDVFDKAYAATPKRKAEICAPGSAGARQPIRSIRQQLSIITCLPSA